MSSKRKNSKTEPAYGYSSETDHLVEFSKPRFKKKRNPLILFCIVVLLVVVVAVGAVGVGVGLGLKFGLQSSSSLPSKITSSNLMKHLQDLEDIANDHPEQFSRAVQYGYNMSAEMVYNKLKEAGYTDIQRQYFEVATYEESGESSLSATITVNNQDYTFEFTRNSQYSVMRYSNSTEGSEVVGNLSVIPDSCNASNYTEGSISLIEYIFNETEAGCSLLDMTEAAASAGVLGMIMMRRVNDSASPPTTRIYNQDGNDFKTSPLPVMGATYLMGKQLKDYLDLSTTGTVQMSMSTNTVTNFWKTYNVLAYTDDGKDDSIIVIGSHLDSVPAGPGINDNGSGSSANLEMAIQLLQNSMKPVNKVLFAFWGAEELGLLGSTHFVNNLTRFERENIALNLNYDMIGSPNYVRQIYNGSGAENPNIIKASAKIQEVFEEYFQSQNLDFSLKGFNGRSDYGPFIAEGIDIPAGGLATGADEVKSEDERVSFGGLANAILDPCYHQVCDTVDNINPEAFLQMSQAAAYALEELMMQEDLGDFLNS